MRAVTDIGLYNSLNDIDFHINSVRPKMRIFRQDQEKSKF